MKKRNFAYLMLLLLVITGMAGIVYSNPLTKKEKKMAIDHLKNSHEVLTKSLKGLSEAQLNYKPSADEWSITEVIQHLSLTENGFWQMLNKSLEQAPNPERRSEMKHSNEDIMAKMAGRETKVKTSENYTPDKSTHKSAKQALEEIKAQRKTMIQFIKTSEQDMHNHLTESPFGVIDAYQVMLMNAAHTRRHLKQIEEIKMNANFPGS